MKNRKSLISLTILGFLFSCDKIDNSNNTIISSLKSNTKTEVVAKKLSNNSYTVDFGQSKKPNVLNIKIKLPTNFNTKSTLGHRAFIKDVKSLEVYLTSDPANPNTGLLNPTNPIVIDTYDGTRLNEAQEFNINIKNIVLSPSMNIYAFVKAYDNINGTTGGGNNIAEEKLDGAFNFLYRGCVSSNFVNINSTTLAYTFNPNETYLDVDLKLLATTSLKIEYPIHSKIVSDKLSNLNMSLDNSGTGFVSWLDTEVDTKTIDFAELKEYIPSIIPSNFTNPTNIKYSKTLTNPTDHHSIFYDSNTKKGLVVFTSIGTIKNISYLPINNGIIGSTEVQITSLTGAQVSEKPQVVLNSNGNGLIIFHSNLSLVGGIETNTNIFAIKVADFIPTGTPFPLFYNQTTNIFKEKPRVALSNDGRGIVTWQEKNSDAGGFYDVILAHVKDYDQSEYNGAGTITITGSNVTGISTFFTDQLQVGARILLGPSVYYVNSITDDTHCTISTTASYPTGVNFNIKGGSHALPNATISIGTPDTVTFAAAPTPPLMAGQRIINKQNGDILIIANSTADPKVYNLLRTPSAQGTYTMLVKEDYLLNQNITGNTTNSKNPDVKMTNSGDGVIAWKDDRYAGPPGNSVKIRGFSALPNFSLSANEVDIRPTGFNINSPTPTFDCPPALTMNNKGEGIVAWSEGNTLINGFYNKFNNFGSSVGAPTQLNTIVSGSSKAIFPVASINADGNGVVAWDYIPVISSNDNLMLRNFINFNPY